MLPYRRAATAILLAASAVGFVGPTAGAYTKEEVAINGVWVCRNGSVGEDRDLVVLPELLLDADFEDCHSEPDSDDEPSGDYDT